MCVRRIDLQKAEDEFFAFAEEQYGTYAGPFGANLVNDDVEVFTQSITPFTDAEERRELVRTFAQRREIWQVRVRRVDMLMRNCML